MWAVPDLTFGRIMLKCTCVHISFSLLQKRLRLLQLPWQVVGDFPASLLKAAPTLISRSIETEAVQLAVMESKSKQGSLCSVQCLGRGSRSAVTISGEVLRKPTGGRDVRCPPGVGDS